MTIMQTLEDKAFVEKLESLSFVPPKDSPRSKSRHDFMALADGTTEALIAKDKAMYKTIKRGNASDRTLNKDVEAIVSERLRKPKLEFREKKKQKIKEMKQRYKARYGCEA